MTRNSNQAKQVFVDFGTYLPLAFSGSDELELKLSTRIGTNPNGSMCGAHSNAVGLRLYFDSTSRPSSFQQNP